MGDLYFLHTIQGRGINVSVEQAPKVLPLRLRSLRQQPGNQTGDYAGDGLPVPFRNRPGYDHQERYSDDLDDISCRRQPLRSDGHVKPEALARNGPRSRPLKFTDGSTLT